MDMRHEPRRARCTLCLTCMNSVLRNDEPWRCAVPNAGPNNPWDCDHYVRRFRQIPLVERRRTPRIATRRRDN